MEIISERKTVEVVEFWRVFDWDSERRGGGFTFPSSSLGNVKVDALAEAGARNYLKCLSGEYEVIDRGVERRVFTYTEPRVGRCACGCEVALTHFTNTCECGSDYNMSGSKLADRTQWGAETGEHWTDCY